MYKKKAIYYLITILNFYLLPNLIVDTGSGMSMLLIIMPLIILGNSIFYGAVFGFKIIFAIITAVLFIPSIFIYYNSSVMLYSIIYGIVSLIGIGIGSYFFKKNRENL
ncbi:MAG: hypothetical protein Q4P34_01490 [Tissierellia bacterium]|nr:hypothetical protein [Tissierellia bacterium]